MERLTRPTFDNAAVYIGQFKNYDTGDIAAEMSVAAIRECVYRLAEYESTGLMPEDIKLMVQCAFEDDDWTPTEEKMPTERESKIPGLGRFSAPVLVTWVDTTSDKSYPEDRFVRESYTRNGEFTLNHINGDLVAVAWKPMPEPSTFYPDK